MAGDWLKWTKGLARKPEVLHIAAQLGRSRHEVASVLMELWEWADDNAQIEEGKGFAGPVSVNQAYEAVKAAKVIPTLTPHGTNQHVEDITKTENVMSSTKQGNSRNYRVARLKRDHPEIVERLAAGEFKSVSAAERAAKGEEPHPKRKEPTALELLKRAWGKASKKEKDAFIEAIGKEGW